MALCRNVPQAHGSLVAGEWARSRYGGIELYGKTLGVIGFGRIGQLVAERARAFDMEVVAFDSSSPPERFRELGVEGVDSSDELYRRADVITIHLPKPRRRSAGSTPTRSRRCATASGSSTAPAAS